MITILGVFKYYASITNSATRLGPGEITPEQKLIPDPDKPEWTNERMDGKRPDLPFVNSPLRKFAVITVILWSKEPGLITKVQK